MNKLADIEFQTDKFAVSGNLCFSNVMAIYKKSLGNMSACPELIFDFSRVTSSDSSGMALIVEWLRLAQEQNKKITFLHLSDDLMSLAKASSLDKIIS